MHSLLSPITRTLALIAAILALPQPAARAVLLRNHDLVVTETNDAAGTGSLLRIDPATGAQSVISAGGLLVQPTDVVLGPSGDLFVSDFGLGPFGKILRVDPLTGKQTVVATGGLLERPTSVAFDAAGQLLVAQQAPVGTLLRIDPNTGQQTSLTSGGYLGVAEDALQEPAGTFLASSYAALSAIVRVNPSSGTQSLLSVGGLLSFGPLDLCFDLTRPHTLLVTATSGLVAVDTLTGAQSLLSTGDKLPHASGIAQDLDGTTYVSDIGPIDNPRGIIVRVDLQTGHQTTVSQAGHLLTPHGLLVVTPEPSLLLPTCAVPLARRRRSRR